MPPSVLAPSSPTENRAASGRRKRARKEHDEAERPAKRSTRSTPEEATAEAEQPEVQPEEQTEELQENKHETSPCDVAAVAELRRPRVTRARGSVLPEFVVPNHCEEEEEEEEEKHVHRPVTRASSKKQREERQQELADKKRGIVRSTRRRGRDAAEAVNRELFRLPTLADLTRVTRSSSRKKPPRPAPAAHPAGVACGCDSGEETEREEDVPEASTPEPAVVREVRVETVVSAVFECSDACLCGDGDGPDESCDERCAAYSPLPFPGFSPPLCADGDDFALGLCFAAP